MKLIYLSNDKDEPPTIELMNQSLKHKGDKSDGPFFEDPGEVNLSWYNQLTKCMTRSNSA